MEVTLPGEDGFVNVTQYFNFIQIYNSIVYLKKDIWFSTYSVVQL